MAITLDGSTNNIAIGANATGSSFLRLYEDTDNGSNYIDVIAPSAVGSNRVLTLPDSTTTIVGTDATQTLTNKTLGSGLVMGVSTLTLETSKNATGVAVDFTGIPSWVRQITLMFNGISTNGTSNLLVQLGTSGGVQATGYSSIAQAAATADSRTVGFNVFHTTLSAATSYFGRCTISLFDSSNGIWVSQGAFGNTSTVALSTGTKQLSGTLDRIRITTLNGTDTFDAGTINILYE